MSNEQWFVIGYVSQDYIDAVGLPLNSIKASDGSHFIILDSFPCQDKAEVYLRELEDTENDEYAQERFVCSSFEVTDLAEDEFDPRFRPHNQDEERNFNYEND